MRVQRWLSLIAVLTMGSSAFASGRIDVSETHGPISLGLGLGYANYRIMNSDGSWAGYKGASYLGSLEIRFLQFDSAAVAVFTDYTLGQTAETSQGGATLEHSALTYGLRLYPTKNFFLGVGYGSASEKLTENSVATTLKHNYTKIGLGFEWTMSGDWSWGLQTNYKSGSISRLDNSSLGTNSAMEGIEGFLMFIWSPNVLNVITGGR